VAEHPIFVKIPGDWKDVVGEFGKLTPQPPSLAGKGEPDSPLLLGEGSDPSSIRQRYLGNRGYKNVRVSVPEG
jgi:hypothetical protein